jgi:hypothetical protein
MVYNMMTADAKESFPYWDCLICPFICIYIHYLDSY